MLTKSLKLKIYSCNDIYFLKVHVHKIIYSVILFYTAKFKIHNRNSKEENL